MSAVSMVDPRISHELAAVDAALERWARWSDNPYPGWPKISMLGKIVTHGPAGAAQITKHARVTEVSRMSERVDAELAKLSVDQQAVVDKHYRRWEPISKSAGALKMSENRFRVLLHRARWRLKEALDL